MGNLLLQPKPMAVRQADSDEQLIDLFLRKMKSLHTKATYRSAIEQFRLFIKQKELPLLMLADLLDYNEHLESVYSNTATRKLKINAVRSLLTFGQEIGYLQFNVGRAVDAPTPENKLAERIVSEAQLLQILTAPQVLRDRLLLRLLYASGMRVSEVCKLQWRHVQPNGQAGQLTVYGKGQKTRFVPIPATVYQLLLSYKPPAALATDYVFFSQKGEGGKRPLVSSTVFRIVKEAGVACGIDGLSPHWLRHAHASHSLARGATVAVVKETLGHSNIAVTNAYVHARPNDSSAFYLPV